MYGNWWWNNEEEDSSEQRIVLTRRFRDLKDKQERTKSYLLLQQPKTATRAIQISLILWVAPTIMIFITPQWL